MSRSGLDVDLLSPEIKGVELSPRPGLEDPTRRTAFARPVAMKVVRDSKFRHVFGNPSKESFQDLRLSSKPLAPRSPLKKRASR